jgi:mannose-6-phosphate isomerase-like protein (cupin superfamily)
LTFALDGRGREINMRKTILGLAATAVLLAAQAPKSSCNRCSATYIDQAEIQAYAAKGKAENITDQQVRSVDIGKSNAAVAVAYRGKLEGPQAVAEHDLVTEIYHVLDGSGTVVTGWDIVGLEARPPDNRAVRLLNGPGGNGKSIRNGVTHELKAGDILVIPAGVGHQFTRIDDHISYLMFRVDPDKAAPPKDKAASEAYLRGERE